MRGFKEEERSVLVSVTLMKGITGFEEFGEGKKRNEFAEWHVA